jgi:hypothetical protein
MTTWKVCVEKVRLAAGGALTFPEFAMVELQSGRVFVKAGGKVVLNGGGRAQLPNRPIEFEPPEGGVLEPFQLDDYDRPIRSEGGKIELPKRTRIRLPENEEIELARAGNFFPANTEIFWPHAEADPPSDSTGVLLQLNVTADGKLSALWPVAAAKIVLSAGGVVS